MGWDLDQFGIQCISDSMLAWSWPVVSVINSADSAYVSTTIYSSYRPAYPARPTLLSFVHKRK